MRTRPTSLWSMMVTMSLLFGLLAVPALAVPPSPDPVFVPGGFSANLYVSDTAATRLNEGPTAMAFAPDGRLFIAERTGAIRIATGELTLLPTPFHALTTIVSPIAPPTQDPDERGLIGLTLDPNFVSNGFVYVNYTVVDPGPTYHNRISRLRASPPGSNVSDGTETILFDMSSLGAATNHVAGSIRFGPDGKLYIATGENSNGPNSQDMTVTHGKILRINPDGTIPTDNPFFATATGNNRAIWTIGMRNPFQMSFRPSDGLFYINDVGLSDFEELNSGTAGDNYGWPSYDGSNLRGGFPAIPGVHLAKYEYDHGYNGFSCAVTGGTFYGGSNYPTSYTNDYFFGDYCGGWAETYDVTTGLNTPFFSNFGFGMVGMTISPSGELYVLRQTGNGRRGTVVRVRYFEVIQDPVNTSVVEGKDATFTCAALGGTAPITYQWQRNGVDIPTATSATYTLSGTVLADNGASFTCIATDSTPVTPLTDTSAAAILAVTTAPATSTPAPTSTPSGAVAAASSSGLPQINVADPAVSKIGVLLPGELGLVGERIEWIVTVTNRGTASAFNVIVTDTLRSELRVDEIRTPKGTSAISGQTATVTFGEVMAGETIQFSIFTTVLQSDVTVDNTACLTADGVSQTCTVSNSLRAGIIIGKLPSTGETPPWRAPLLMGLAFMVGLFLISLGLAGRRLRRSQG